MQYSLVQCVTANQVLDPGGHVLDLVSYGLYYKPVNINSAEFDWQVTIRVIRYGMQVSVVVRHVVNRYKSITYFTFSFPHATRVLHINHPAHSISYLPATLPMPF